MTPNQLQYSNISPAHDNVFYRWVGTELRTLCILKWGTTEHKNNVGQMTEPDLYTKPSHLPVVTIKKV